MAIQVSGQVIKGFLANVGSGTSGLPIAQDQFGATLVSELNARYASLVQAGAVYSVGQTSAAALSAVGTGVTGLTLFNPSTSGKNLIILDLALGFTPLTLATVGITVVLAGTAQATTPTGVVAITPTSNLVGGNNSPVAKTYSSATLAASPAIMRVVGNWQSTVLTTSGGATATAAYLKDEIAGLVLMQPGSAICLAGIGTVADASVAASITWAELPV